jgi:glycosyltransferase involved in cell wall biosynthesis
MRITFVNRLAGVFWGGGETFDLEVARAFIQLGHNVQFVVGRRLWRLDSPMLEFPTTYIRTPYLRWLMYRGDASRKMLLRRIGWRAGLLDIDMFERTAFKRIAKNGIAGNTDIFQINGLPRLGAWIKEALHTKSVVLWHGPPGPEARCWNERCSATLAYGGSVDAVRSNADPKALEISIGVDTEVCRRAPADGIRNRYHIPPDGIVFVFVGRMIPIKNLPFLIESFASAVEQNRLLYLLLVGDGPSKPDLLEQVSALGLRERVIFAGRQTSRNLIDHYNAADVFTITSTYDNFPFVVLEAMACELPVIATRVGGLPKSVDDGRTGLLVESGDVENLRSAMLAMAKDKDRRREMGRCGREKVVKKHSWLETARQMLRVYEGL